MVHPVVGEYERTQELLHKHDKWHNYTTTCNGHIARRGQPRYPDRTVSSMNAVHHSSLQVRPLPPSKEGATVASSLTSPTHETADPTMRMNLSFRFVSSHGVWMIALPIIIQTLGLGGGCISRCSTTAVPCNKGEAALLPTALRRPIHCTCVTHAYSFTFHSSMHAVGLWI